MSVRPSGRVCLEVDPIQSPLQNGKPINRHCHLPFGHEGWHESVDRFDEVVHQWLWERETEPAVLLSQGSLFDGGGCVG